jgi:hypothetical protein
MAFACLSPVALRCDLLVVLGNFAHGAERVASRLLGRAIAEGVAKTALHVNAFQVPRDPTQAPLAVRVEEVLDATRRPSAKGKWESPRAIRNGFHVYDDEDARDFVSMCKLPRGGRIAVPRSRWKVDIAPGEYPVTVSL